MFDALAVGMLAVAAIFLASEFNATSVKFGVTA